MSKIVSIDFGVELPFDTFRLARNCSILAAASARSRPVLAFCSRERPFRELVLSSLSEDSRREIAKELYARFRQADERQFRYLLRSGFQTAPDGFQRFNAFLDALAGSRRHPGTVIHLITVNVGLQGLPAVRDWLAKNPYFRMHYAPWGRRGPRWSELAGRWLQVIADWPMQTSFLESAFQLRERLRQMPADGGPQTIVIS